MGFGWLFMLLPLAGLVLLFAIIARIYDGGRSGGGATRTPREILDERFAKGEIDREDYEDRRKTLGG